jgi:hypothetical protein
MDGQRFDKFSRTLATPGTRRGLLRILPALSMAATVPALVAALAERAAAHPVERIQKRRDHHRKRARRRQDQRHEQRTRDNGQGGAPGAGWDGCTPLENLCVALGRECCPHTECVKLIPSKFDVVGSCQSRSCATTAECAARFPKQDVICETNGGNCPGFLRGSCCLPKSCGANSDCAHSGLCCASKCCAPGQTCTLTGCFGGTHTV